MVRSSHGRQTDGHPAPMLLSTLLKLRSTYVLSPILSTLSL